MYIEEQVGDDTSVEEQADDGASTEEEVQPQKDDKASDEKDSPEKLAEIARNQRIRAEKAEARLKELEKSRKTTQSPDIEKQLEEKLEQRDLDAMEYPDDIKTVIKQVAQYNQTSVRKAQSDPYVKSKIDAWEKENKANEAAISRTNKASGKESDDINEIPDVDLTTEEGRKEYDKWKEKMIKKGY